MGPLSAFMTTWTSARSTFGNGAPVDGTQFNGNGFRAAETLVEGASPDANWSGVAADTYRARNRRHQQAFGRLADLDRRMAAEIADSASVVSTGRRSLDEVREWAAAMDASITSGAAGDRLRQVVASRGLGQVVDIVSRSSAALDTIGSRIGRVGGEYDDVNGLLGADWKQSPPDVTDEDTRTHDEKVAEWFVKIEMWNRNVAELHATRPPDNTTDIAAAEAWNARRRELVKEQAELVQEGVELGIEMPPPPDQQRSGMPTSTTPAGTRPAVRGQA